MSLILDGTNGLSDVDGTAATPAIRGTDTNTGIFFPAADTIAFSEGGAESARFDSSGNLGIGTTSPVSRLQVANTTATRLTISKAANSITDNEELGSILWRINGGAGTVMGNIYYTGNAGSSGDGTGALVFGARGNSGASTLVESMRIASSGDVLIGGTTTIGGNGILLANADYTATYRNTGTSGAYIHAFASDIGGTRTVKYAIYANGTAAAVSDQNFKKNIEPARNYLNDLMNIEVVKYNWVSDEENAPKELGYIAQQVETVFAGLVDEQTYDDGDGNPVTQKMLKKEVFIPMMLKAIQELKAELDTVKAELVILKA
jgi:hypothetical protein